MFPWGRSHEQGPSYHALSLFPLDPSCVLMLTVPSGGPGFVNGVAFMDDASRNPLHPEFLEGLGL